MLSSRQSPYVGALATTFVTALVLPSCNYVFNEAPAGSDAAAVDATLDSMPVLPRLGLAFGSPEPTLLVGEDPSVSNDGLHIWLVTQATAIDRDVSHVQRVSDDQLFGMPTQFNINTGGNEVNGAVTEDQLLVTFASDFGTPGAYKIKQAQRPSPDMPFENSTTIGLEFSLSNGFDASPDGRRIFFVQGNSLKSNIRSGRGPVYTIGPEVKLSDPNVSYPTVSFDRLELVYVGADSKHLVRALLSPDGTSYGAPQPFDVGVNCATIATPAFSPNAMLLTFSCDGTIYITRRPAS